MVRKKVGESGGESAGGLVSVVVVMGQGQIKLFSTASNELTDTKGASRGISNERQITGRRQGQ